MKKLLALLVLVGVMTVAFGCATTRRVWDTGIKQAAKKEVKVEVKSQSDELATKELLKELSINVIKAPDADPALSDVMLEEMKGNVIDQFTDDGWAIRGEASLKLHVVMSLCNSNDIAGSAVFEEEGKPFVTFLLTLTRSKKIISLSSETTFVSDRQLRSTFGQAIVQAIDSRAKVKQQ